jgi:hypothetical protein
MLLPPPLLLACLAPSCYGTRRSAEGYPLFGSPASRSRATALGARLKAARLTARLHRDLALRHSALG